MRTEDEMRKVVKQWYSKIADSLARHDLVVFMCYNTGENKSKDIKEFFKCKGAQITSASLMSSGRMRLQDQQ
jgi:hypothetical protein